jgi:cyclopropane fatty-acyl-phospholipid synthase-like methyltransferase
MRWVSFILALACLPAMAQDPRFSNKLSPYVRTPDRIMDRMLELANIKPGDTVYDLGCGDGRIVIAAALRYKAKAVGVEISPKLAAQATSAIDKAGLKGRARIIQGDLLQADLTGADVVTIYLGTQLNAELRPRMEKYLHAGARVVSHDYAVPGWKATRTERTEGKQGHVIYVYEMPPAKDPGDE